jgi:transcription initiation factor TFIIIB Brf1 subunit/transcription initiation factor TFIIB
MLSLSSEIYATDDDWMQLLQDMSNDPDDIMSAPPTRPYKAADVNLEIQVIIDKGDKDKISKHSICTKCKKEGRITNSSIICVTCGLELSTIEDHGKYSFAVNNDHNTSSNSFMSFNFVGKNAYCYQRSFLKTCANYSSYRRNNNKKDLYNYNYQHEGKKIPKNAIKLAIELFSTIKENKYVYRGNGKKGVLGACLFYACVMNHITKTPREIASIMNIEERFLSQGDRKVQEINELGIINIPTLLRPLNDYLDQYFPTLGIPAKYKQFVIDIINRAGDKNIHIRHDSRTTTKAIGGIYLLTLRVKSLKHITKDVIVKELNISRSTFSRYCGLLMDNWKLLKPVFKKHSIPMPVKWRVVKTNTSTKNIS